MIVAFVLDPSALRTGLEGTDPAQSNAQHTTLLDLWRSSGVLVCDLNAADSDLARAVEDLPQSLRNRWQMALRRQMTLPRPADWCGPASLRDPGQLAPLVGSADVIFLEPAKALQLGVAAGQASCTCPSGIEITRFDCASESECFRQARDIRERQIERGTTTSGVWKHRFQRLSRISRTVVAVDRYAIVNLKEHGDRSGVLSLAKKLNREERDGPGAHLTVYASIGDHEVKELKNALAPVLAQVGKGVREIEVFLIEDRVFRREAHGRYLRFENFVCEIDTGLEILAGDKVRRRSQFTMKGGGPQRRLEEQKLRSHRVERITSATELLL